MSTGDEKASEIDVIILCGPHERFFSSLAFDAVAHNALYQRCSCSPPPGAASHGRRASGAVAACD